MKTARPNAAKDLYKQLRCFSWEQLWMEHVPAFNKASPPSEARNAGLVRAVGVVFSESGLRSQKNEVTAWLRSLLQDPDEKVRRYAMAALPKIGAESVDEEALINLLRKANPPEREKKFLARALDKIGGKATLEIADELPGQTALKVKASVAREESPSEIRLDKRWMSFQVFGFTCAGAGDLRDSFARNWSPQCQPEDSSSLGVRNLV